ncbi:MAG: flagellar protein FlgN [Lachnospiraceae bacterium]|nr:flagellar protein FlgN [Lachnospiraceae bacterium]
MASLIDELINVLEQENKEYETLMLLSKEKTPVIVKGDLEKLQRITQVEQEFIGKITNLEKKRTDVMNDIGTVLSKDPKTMRVVDVIEILSKQPVEQNRLSEVHDKLLTTLENFKKYNEVNANLIKESLEIIDFNLNLVTSLYQDTGIANYDKNAKSISAMGATGVFDRKS